MVKWEIELPENVEINSKIYNINGRAYARVTRTLGVISKPGLLVWFQRVGKKKADHIMKTRQVLGTHAHSLFEKLAHGKKIDASDEEDEIKMDVRLFKNFKKHCILTPDATEQKLWSDEFEYAGTADYIGTYKSNEEWLVRGWKPKFKNASLVIGDWKTSRDIYDEYWLQLAAYCWAFYERTGIKVKGAFIAQFRDGKIRIKEKSWKELMLDFEIYKSVLILYRWKYKKWDD